jgi:hypothetical protein
VTEATPGAIVARPAWARELEEPDGTKRPLTDARITAPTRAGVYFWLRGAVRAGALVVNPEVAESDLARLPISELRARFSGATIEATDEAAIFTASAFTLSGRRTLDGLFIAAALVLLAAEAFATRAVPKSDAGQ